MKVGSIELLMSCGPFREQMRNVGLIIMIMSISSCRPDNADFDPFDNEFKFHQNFKLQDYDSITGECGYWNLTKKNNNGLWTYYQFFLDEEIVAKGFSLDIDEIPIINKDSLNTENGIIKLLERYPIDFESAKQKLSIFNIREIKIKEPVSTLMRIELIDSKDSVYQASIMTFFEETKMTRQLTYFNNKEKYVN